MNHEHAEPNPELVEIIIDERPCVAFKWWDKRTANEHEVRYVFKEPADGCIFYMLIVCANRIPEGTGLAAVACYPDGTPDTYGYLPAETQWDNGEQDGSSRIMVMRPKDGFPEYRGLPRDLEEMIRDHREGKRQVRRFEKKDTTVDAIKHVDERLYSVQQQVDRQTDLLKTVGNRAEIIQQHVKGVPVLQEERDEARMVPESVALEIQKKIAEILEPEDQRIWMAVREAKTQKGALKNLRQYGIKSTATLSRRVKVINKILREHNLPPCVGVSGPETRYRKIGGHTNEDGKTSSVDLSPVERDWAKDPSDRDATIQSFLAVRTEEDKAYFRQTYPGIEDEAEKYLKRLPIKSR